MQEGGFGFGQKTVCRFAVLDFWAEVKIKIKVKIKVKIKIKGSGRGARSTLA